MTLIESKVVSLLNEELSYTFSRGSYGLYVLFRAIAQESGCGEVVLPTLCCETVALSAIYAGHKVIFADVSNDMRIAREEIFGPVLVIIPFEDEAEAISIANDTPYGLASFLQTGDPERAERVAAKLRAGSVHINGGGLEYGTPFGGYKQSGNGREGGMMGLHDYLEAKTLHGVS